MSNAQVTINEGILPSINDTMWTLTDNMPNINLGNAGGNKFWDFSSLSSGMGRKKKLSHNNPNVNPPNIEYDFVIEEEGEIFRFYKRLNSALFEIAVQQPHPLNSGFEVLSKYQTPKLICYAEMKYEDDKTTNALIYYTLPGNNIPSLIQKKLPITADSIRIKVEEVQDMHTDAWGSVRLSYDNFDVLRQALTISRTTTAEVYSAGKWSRINDYILDPNQNILGKRSDSYYIFYANDAKEPIAKVKVGASQQPLYAEFKGSTRLGSLININTGERAFILSPNPSFGNVKLELVNTELGEYTFEIYNVIGKRLWKDELLVNRKFTSYKFDFSFLGKGTYLWALTNSQGVRITTKRLVIITP